MESLHSGLHARFSMSVPHDLAQIEAVSHHISTVSKAVSTAESTVTTPGSDEGQSEEEEATVSLFILNGIYNSEFRTTWKTTTLRT
jgi:hypothetical protein